MAETPREAAMRGFKEAVTSLREWVADDLSYESPSPFANAMDRLYAVEASFVLERGDAYYDRRNGDPLGRVVGGIVHARGLHSHARGFVHELRGRRPFRTGKSKVRSGDTLRGQGVTIRWPLFANLPPPHNKQTHDRDIYYQDHVEGRGVLETFEDALKFFAAL